jgi:phosphatidylglycerol:prolipoprotein diacylglycerol transferase
MPPVLLRFEVFGHELGLSTYGVFLALAFAAGGSVCVLAGGRAGLPARASASLAMWAAAAGLLVARAGGALVPEAAHASPAPLWWHAGLVGAAVGAAVFAARRGAPALATFDVLAPAAAAAQAVGAIGCLAAGCCFGAVATPGTPGVSFGRGTVAYQDLLAAGAIPFVADTTPPLVPVQLVEVAAYAGLAALVALGLRRGARPGMPAAAYLAGAGLVPLALAPLRPGPPPLAATLLLVGAALGLILFVRHAKTTPHRADAGAHGHAHGHAHGDADADADALRGLRR